MPNRQPGFRSALLLRLVPVPNPFPIGAWVADQQTGAATRGVVKAPDGTWTFQPYRGEIVRYSHIAKHPAYIVQFGQKQGIILASAATASPATT